MLGVGDGVFSVSKCFVFLGTVEPQEGESDRKGTLGLKLSGQVRPSLAPTWFQ